MKERCELSLVTTTLPRWMRFDRMASRVLFDRSSLQILASQASHSLSFSPFEISFSGLKALSLMGSSSPAAIFWVEKLATLLATLLALPVLGSLSASSLLEQAFFSFSSRTISLSSLRKESSFSMVLTSLPLMGRSVNLQLDSPPAFWLLLMRCWRSLLSKAARLRRLSATRWSACASLRRAFWKRGKSRVRRLRANILKYSVTSSLLRKAVSSKKAQKLMNFSRSMVCVSCWMSENVLFLLCLYRRLHPNSNSPFSYPLSNSYLLASLQWPAQDCFLSESGTRCLSLRLSERCSGVPGWKAGYWEGGCIGYGLSYSWRTSWICSSLSTISCAVMREGWTGLGRWAWLVMNLLSWASRCCVLAQRMKMLFSCLSQQVRKSSISSSAMKQPCCACSSGISLTCWAYWRRWVPMSACSWGVGAARQGARWRMTAVYLLLKRPTMKACMRLDFTPFYSSPALMAYKY